MKESEMKCADCKFWDKESEQAVYMHTTERDDDIIISRCLHPEDTTVYRHPKDTEHVYKCDYFEPDIKEITPEQALADLEKLHGCTVKIGK